MGHFAVTSYDERRVAAVGRIVLRPLPRLLSAAKSGRRIEVPASSGTSATALTVRGEGSVAARVLESQHNKHGGCNMRWLTLVSVCLLSAAVGLVAGIVVDGLSRAILTVALVLLGAGGLYVVKVRRE